jgi:hypothetical protein
MDGVSRAIELAQDVHCTDGLSTGKAHVDDENGGISGIDGGAYAFDIVACCLRGAGDTKGDRVKGTDAEQDEVNKKDLHVVVSSS